MERFLMARLKTEIAGERRTRRSTLRRWPSCYIWFLYPILSAAFRPLDAISWICRRQAGCICL